MSSTSALDRKRRRLHLRRRRRSDDEKEESGSASEEDELEKRRLAGALEDIRDLQKLRTKSAGLSAAELALGKEIPREVQMISDDPLKLKSGGLLDLRRVKRSDIQNADIEEDIKQQFSRESHLRDEDEEMRKFVEEEVMRRKGGPAAPEQVEPAKAERRIMTEDDLLEEAADKLKKYSSKKNEEMLSNQMLCGIPEVDLGIDAKIRNVEDTENAKLRLLKESIEQRKNIEEATSFKQDLVKNLASDYVQHRIYNIADTTDLGSEAPRHQPTNAMPRWALDTQRFDPPLQMVQNSP